MVLSNMHKQNDLILSTMYFLLLDQKVTFYFI